MPAADQMGSEESRGSAFGLLVVACSAGGFRPLSAILESLPGDFSVPLAVVMHLTRSRPGDAARAIGVRTRLRVTEARGGEKLRAGSVYLAPPDRHLVTTRGGTLALSKSAAENFVRPAADVLFRSAASVYRDRLLALVLSGTGQDGALGVRAVKKAGGMVIVQSDPEFAAMPGAALGTGSVDLIVPLSAIPDALLHLVGRRP